MTDLPFAEAVGGDELFEGRRAETEPEARAPSGAGWVVTRVILPLGILAFAGLGAAWLVLTRPPPQQDEAAIRPPLVETIRLEGPPERIRVEVDGTVLPQREIGLASEVRGRVVKKSPRMLAGQYLPKAGEASEREAEREIAAAEAGPPDVEGEHQLQPGELLVIDPVPYQLAVRRLKQEIEQVHADLENLAQQEKNTEELIRLARAGAEIARRDYERADNLSSRGAQSEQARDQASSALLAAKEKLQNYENQQRLFGTQRKQLRARLEVARAQLDEAELDLERTRIRMPVDGVLSEVMVEEKGYVSEGTVVAKVQDTSRMEVRCELQVADLIWLRQGQSAGGDDTAGLGYLPPEAAAEVRYEAAGREFVYRGRLDRFEGTGLQQDTRTLPVRVVIDDPEAGKAGAALLRGTFVEVALTTPVAPGGLIELPLKALRNGENVWRLKGGKLEVVPVRVARYQGEAALVFAKPDVPEGSPAVAPLRKGDEVIISPLLLAADGMEVRVRN